MSCGCAGYGGYGAGYGAGYGTSGFSLIVVLFILLIIVGCGCLLGPVAPK